MGEALEISWVSFIFHGGLGSVPCCLLGLPFLPRLIGLLLSRELSICGPTV